MNCLQKRGAKQKYHIVVSPRMKLSEKKAFAKIFAHTINHIRSYSLMDLICCLNQLEIENKRKKRKFILNNLHCYMKVEAFYCQELLADLDLHFSVAFKDFMHTLTVFICMRLSFGVEEENGQRKKRKKNITK